jgi:hypothetical protein
MRHCDQDISQDMVDAHIVTQPLLAMAKYSVQEAARSAVHHLHTITSYFPATQTKNIPKSKEPSPDRPGHESTLPGGDSDRDKIDFSVCVFVLYLAWHFLDA